VRVALVVPGFSAHAGDWAIPALLQYARALARQHELHVFSLRYPAPGDYHFDGLVHHALGGGQRFGPASARLWLQASLALIQAHRRAPFDLLHAFWADEAGFAAALAGVFLQRPVLVSLGGGELTHLPDINYGARRFLARRLTTGFALKQAAIVTAGSAYQLELARTHQALAGKLRLAPLGVDTGLFRPAASPLPLIQPDGPHLAQAASLLPVKNQALLLQIFRLVRRELPAARLHLAGDGPLHTELARLAEQLGLSACVTWYQHRPYPEMPSFYQAAHLYLQTSCHESQGLAVLEAMACGLPALGTPVGVLPEVACLPPQSSQEALAAQVIEILSSETRYRAARDQARSRIEARFSLPATVENFLQVYTAAMNR
jgi:glycosyltransferase involved in cell wall biosynthesis